MCYFLFDVSNPRCEEEIEEELLRVMEEESEISCHQEEPAQLRASQSVLQSESQQDHQQPPLDQDQCCSK